MSSPYGPEPVRQRRCLEKPWLSRPALTADNPLCLRPPGAADPERIPLYRGSTTATPSAVASRPNHRSSRRHPDRATSREAPVAPSPAARSRRARSSGLAPGGRARSRPRERRTRTRRGRTHVEGGGWRGPRLFGLDALCCVGRPLGTEGGEVRSTGCGPSDLGTGRPAHVRKLSNPSKVELTGLTNGRPH